MMIWYKLICKEFDEQKWKLVSLTSIVFAIFIAGVVESRGQDAMGIVAVLYSYLLLAPLYLGMGVSAGEHSSRSISFVNALPCHTWKIGAARLLSGWIILLIPLVLISLVTLATLFAVQLLGYLPGSLFAGADIPEYFSAYDEVLLLTFIGIGWCTNLYAWVCFTTSNQKTELRAGLIGLSTMLLLIYLGLIALSSAHSMFSGKSPFELFVAFIGPMVWLIWLQLLALNQMFLLSVAVFVQFLTIMVLWTISAMRYGRSEIISLEWLPQIEWRSVRRENLLLRPFASERSALFWMQFRHSLPIIAAGLSVFFLVWGVAVASQAQSYSSVFSNAGPFIGCVLAIVIGIGSFVHELDPKLYAFWRSRPISPTQWFWLKYLAGAAVLIFCFDLPLLIISRISVPLEGVIGQFFFPTLLHLFVYTCSVLAACLIRHPVYAPILAVCGNIAFLLGPESLQNIIPNLLYERFSFFQLWRDFSISYFSPVKWESLILAILLIVPVTLFTSFLAHWSIKKDISFSP